MADVIELTLNDEDIADCEELARKRAERVLENRKRGLPSQPGDRDSVFRNHRIGAFCECACALYLWPIEWHRHFDERMHTEPDLGTFIDVKGSDRGNNRLIVPPVRSKPDWAYLWATTERFPTTIIHGWVFGREAMIPRYWRDKAATIRHFFEPAYFVPSTDLHPSGPEPRHFLKF